jgi:hypothetical protein
MEMLCLDTIGSRASISDQTRAHSKAIPPPDFAILSLDSCGNRLSGPLPAAVAGGKGPGRRFITRVADPDAPLAETVASTGISKKPCIIL